MPSTRRLKTFGFLLAVGLFTIFYLTNDSRRASTQDFYETTVNALKVEQATDAEAARRLEENRHTRKKDVEPEAAGLASPLDEHAQLPIDIEIPSKEDGGARTGKAVTGRKKMKGGERWDMASGKEAKVDKDGQDVKHATQETKEDHEVEVELNAILKKGPIIVFSKSYCPFSAKAKHILLEKYTIVPAPYVVELDQHPLGGGLQAALAKSTGRRTVPNVLINGKSIGGGDDVEALDMGGSLIDKIRNMAGKRIMEARLAQ